MEPPSNRPCKICQGNATQIFTMPWAKRAAHPIPEEDARGSCAYYECSKCGFVFTPDTDHAPQDEVYDDTYWTNQDADWHGRVAESLRLVMMGALLTGKRPDQINILDFGCGMGAPVQKGRDLGLKMWGTDLITPKFGLEWYLKDIGSHKFDVIIACEVVEHFTDPLATFQFIADHLVDGGAFVFQTAFWDPASCNRDWWYIGPGNGHISFYSVGAFDALFQRVGGRDRIAWNGYPGLQVWQIGGSSVSLQQVQALVDQQERLKRMVAELAAQNSQLKAQLAGK